VNSYEYQDAILASHLSANAKLTALAISYHYNWKQAKASFPSNRLIADRTSLSIRSVIRAKNELVSSGFLISDRRYNKSNTYVPVSPTPCHTVTLGVSDWQPNNEYNYEVNNEEKKRDSDESLLAINNNIASEKIWKVFENEKRNDAALAAGRGNRNARKKYRNSRRDNLRYEEEQRNYQELDDSREAYGMGRN